MASHTPWADEPFRLISTPSKRPGLSDRDFYVRAATGMAHAHNAIIRGLNAIVQQAPCVASSSSSAPRDATDLLFYVRAWAKMVRQHHAVEETYLFPELARFSGAPGLLAGPLLQHARFEHAVERLRAYAAATRPHEYRWHGGGGMRELVDAVGAPLTEHLHAEIDVFLGLGHLDAKGYEEVWVGAHKLASQSGNLRSVLYDVFPCVYGCADRTFEGGHTFPNLPWILPYLIKYWFALGNGAWRFNPCDFWGRPRPLAFTPHIT
ncbi:hypothetical protein F4780DRAFT_777200 [Xylariomycetidae sp. FL0641]|nr:hypothetical protein F4780DRAFT_777200 [Xylariomycetidae sp. FL0641]